jgi:hypothetical protein
VLDRIPAKRGDREVAAKPQRGQSQLDFTRVGTWIPQADACQGQIPEKLLSAPRADYRNASQLAKAAGASVMSAFRLLRMLEAEGFLDVSDGRLRLIRLEDVMRRWRAAYLRPVREWPMRWILRGDPASHLHDLLRDYARLASRPPRARPRGQRLSLLRVCLGLFAAADALGLGFVHGVKPHLYIEEIRPDVLQRLGLSRADPGHPADVLVRVPPAPKSVFRGVVRRDGLPVSDILQVWLDVADHPARGEAQAREIQRRRDGREHRDASAGGRLRREALRRTPAASCAI